MIRRRLACAVVVAAAAAGIAVGACKPRSAGPGAGGVAPVASSGGSAAARVAPRELERAWHVGDQRTYAVDLASEARVGDRPLTQFRLAGQLVVTAVDVSAERTMIHASVIDPKLRSDLAQVEGPLAGLESELTTPFFFELDNGRSVSSSYFTDQPSGLVFGIRQLLASALQPVPRGTTPTWTAEQRDGTGRYEAEYRPGGQPGEIDKRKIRYLSLDATTSAPRADSSELVPKVVESHTSIRLAEHGFIDTLQSDEKLATGSNQMVPIDSTTHLSLRTVGAERLEPGRLPAWNDLLSKAHPAGLARPERSAAESKQLDEARIAGRTLAQVLAGLRALDGQPPPVSEADKSDLTKRRADLFAALEGLVRTREGTVPKVVAMIKAHDAMTPTLVDALGASGSSEAQGALVKLLREKSLDDKAMRVVAIALSRTPHPTDEATSGLVDLLDVQGLRTQALYGLGTQVRRLREAGDEERSSKTLEIILGRLRDAKNNVQQITALRAIANSGHEAAAPALEPFLRAKDDEVRAAAVEALQIMHVPNADSIIASGLSTDPAPAVRLAASRAAVLRKPSPELEAAATSAVRGDQDPHVRLGALRVLMTWLPSRPALGPVIRDVADHDSQELIQTEARTALASVSVSGGGGAPR